ncbi:MAG TPA: tRNA pseudouridine(13) synthase TruD [Polyangiaceae bacterium]|nr:tRNA pseudouridine(13) synthase TruD [Polyangiaceae bacterium]
MSERIPGILKAIPEDFVVEEIPAYEPSGHGDHVFVRFRKRDLTTDVAVRAIAGALGASSRDAGVAGMKDKRAVTVQTISLFPPRGTPAEELARAAGALTLPGIEILDVRRHEHKLKTGHLRGNRFVIRVRGVPASRSAEVGARFAEIAGDGVPNAFGAQRFGAAGDNAARARAILEGKEPAPRDKRLLRLLYSALQSAVFNDVLAERVARGSWTTALLGDVLKKEDTGGLFVCTDPVEDAARAARGELSATGPMFGPKTMQPSGEPAEIETAMLVRHLGADYASRYAPELGEGTRRLLRLRVAGLTAREAPAEPLDVDPTAGNHHNPVATVSGEEQTSWVVEFVLPRGAFATTVLEQIVVQPSENSGKIADA